MRRPIALKDALEELYARYNRRAFVHPDPVEFLHLYDEPGDREVVGLVASVLAYGRVAQILASVSRVLERMGPRPREFLVRSDGESLAKTFTGFRHRFADGGHLGALLAGMKRIIEEYGSIEEAFASGMRGDDDNVIPALCAFLGKIDEASGNRTGHLVPSADGKSACKRMHLYLRWMVRRDEVDPGGWEGISPAKLIVPLDTHLHRIGLRLGFTRRRQADARTAIEITQALRDVSPDDPVRYDFCLTRLGIRRDGDVDEFLSRCAGLEKEHHE